MKALLFALLVALASPQPTFADEAPAPKALKCDLAIGDVDHRSVTAFDANGNAWYVETFEDFELSAFASNDRIGILTVTNHKLGIDVSYFGKNDGITVLNMNGTEISFACVLD